MRNKRFTVYDCEDKTVLELINKLGAITNGVQDSLDNKTDLYGDHKGSWQGLNRPTMSEEGMRATVEDIIDNKIPSIQSSLNNMVLHTKGSINIFEYSHLVVDGDWSNAFNTAIQENENFEIIIPDGEYLIKSPIIVNKTVKLRGASKLGTIIRTDTDINMVYLQKQCEISNLTFKINLLTHSSTVITYYAIKGGNKFGKVNDVYIVGLDGYQNNTKAFRLANLDGDATSKSYFFFYTFDNINVEFCDTFLLIDADFTKCWSTAVTWNNVIVERCKRGVLFDTPYVAGTFSRYDYINCQFQYNTKTDRVFNSPTDRSLIDWHVWDRSFFYETNPNKSIFIQKGGRHNRFIIRNIDETQVEYVSPKDTFMNEFTFYDSPMSKNILRAEVIHVNYNNGDDSTADGSINNPYKSINTVLSLLPKSLNNNIIIKLGEGTFNDNVTISGFYGGGTLKILGDNKLNTWANSVSISNNRCKVELQGFSVRHGNNGNGVTITDSDIVNINNVDTICRDRKGSCGYFIQGTKVTIRNSTIQKNANGLIITASSTVWLDQVNGDNNDNGANCQRGSFVGMTAGLPSGFATELYLATQGGLINTKGTILV